MPLGAAVSADRPCTSAGSSIRDADLPAFEVAFLPTDRHVGQMRHITATCLRNWGLADLTDSATLVVSELVTNAVRYGKGHPIGLRVSTGADELRIEVVDGSTRRPRLQEADDDAENGRGLALVAALAREWGVSRDGMTTWCALDLPPSEGAL